MPCRSDYDEAAERADLRRELDRVTDMLCWACEVIDVAELEWRADVRQWWSKHQESDQARRADELRRLKIAETRDQALAKLSAEERAALGLR